MRRFLSWDILCLLLLYAFAGFVVYYPITDTDIWWHLAAAREMIRAGGFLRADPFSYTPHDANWINLHWLFQLGLYLIHSIASFGGVLIAKSILFAAACLIASRAVMKTHPLAALIVFSALMYEVRYLALARPVIITLLLMAMFLWCLERFVATGKRRFLIMLLPAQAIWANTQGLFMLGPAIAFAYWAGEVVPGFYKSLRSGRSSDRRQATGPQQRYRSGNRRTFLVRSGLFALIPAANLINPYGWRGLGLSAKLFGRINPSLSNIYALNVSENLPLRFLVQTEPRYVYAVAVALLCAVIGFWINRRALRPSHILLTTMFFVLAWMAQRNILLFFFILAPIIAANCAPLFRKHPRSTRIGFSILAALILGLHTHAHSRILSICPSQSRLSPFRHPVEAADYLQKHPIPGNGFNCIRAGGYLLWRFFPPRKVFIDGRLVLRTPEFFAQYLTILDNPHLFPQVARKFDITHALLPTAIFDRYFPLTTALYHDPEWSVAWADGGWILFVRDSILPTTAMKLADTATIDTIVGHLARRWRGDPWIFDENCLYLGNLLMRLQNYDAAGYAFSRMRSGEAALHMARVHLSRNQLDSAATLVGDFVGSHPNNQRARLMLARILVSHRDYRGALENVILVLRRDPLNREAASLLKHIKHHLQ